MEKLANIHPGEILLEEFLVPMNISAYRLSKDLDIPQTRISQIIKGNRRITADTALRLSAYFGTTAKFWLGLQDDYDLEFEGTLNPEVIKSIRTRIAHTPAAMRSGQ
ncbi:MAG: addiction module antidote protein, HigA family [Bacteroidetes bacterium GWF2_49_14]|nr:MAG: addiction module antidote protein, HigA family [Bacteroidetes bacterium GWF2_49_14]